MKRSDIELKPQVKKPLPGEPFSRARRAYFPGDSWPAVAAQLRDTIGTADRATVLATAALAVNQVDRVLRAIRGGDGRVHPGPPPTLDTTLEFDVGASSIVARRWARHPRCSC